MLLFGKHSWSPVSNNARMACIQLISPALSAPHVVCWTHLLCGMCRINTYANARCPSMNSPVRGDVLTSIHGGYKMVLSLSMTVFLMFISITESLNGSDLLKRSIFLIPLFRFLAAAA